MMGGGGVVHFRGAIFVKGYHTYRLVVIVRSALFNAVIHVHARLHFFPAQDFFRLFPFHDCLSATSLQ